MSKAQIEAIIEEVVKDIYLTYPELLDRFGEIGKVKCKEDNGHHFKNLETAYVLKDPKIFVDYAHWLNHLLTSRGMKTEHITDNFERIRDKIKGKLPVEIEEFYEAALVKAISSLN
ncbi:hypothetical protein [Bacillus sp. PS06]|uniref:hypothetical protein n=1 Tax=Bacillus sp. PS06 TaxID=2764176 RepID=UPI00178098CA|nr:hypothetical protein [Bacillus sp. PS06]MBD8070158.1 hypothetical protein [Bacillus sp. PS06]